MLKNSVSRWVVLYEVLGLVVVILFLWVNELFDLPGRFLGLPPTPVNVAEAAYESIVVAALGIAIIAMTHSLLRKIKVLEGFLPVCASCKKIRKDGEWVQIECYIRDHSEASFTHSLCPECARKLYGDQIVFGEDNQKSDDKG